MEEWLLTPCARAMVHPPLEGDDLCSWNNRISEKHYLASSAVREGKGVKKRVKYDDAWIGVHPVEVGHYSTNIRPTVI